MAAVKIVPFRGEARYLEAKVVKLGVQIAAKAKMHSIIVESDCLEVTNLVNNKQGRISEIQSKCK